MPVSGVGQREAAAVLADWRGVEAAIGILRASTDMGRAHIAELADLHAEARRLRVEYTEIIRRPTVSSGPVPGGG
jgi:hypothetical protein